MTIVHKYLELILKFLNKNKFLINFNSKLHQLKVTLSTTKN